MTWVGLSEKVLATAKQGRDQLATSHQSHQRGLFHQVICFRLAFLMSQLGVYLPLLLVSGHPPPPTARQSRCSSIACRLAESPAARGLVRAICANSIGRIVQGPDAISGWCVLKS